MCERLFWSGAALAANLISATVLALPACAETPAGQLRCDVAVRPGLDVATNRQVSCIYRRPRAPLEFYYGYTGFVALTAGAAGALAFYDVLSSDPKGPSVLSGTSNTLRFEECGRITSGGRLV